MLDEKVYEAQKNSILKLIEKEENEQEDDKCSPDMSDEAITTCGETVGTSDFMIMYYVDRKQINANTRNRQQRIQL